MNKLKKEYNRALSVGINVLGICSAMLSSFIIIVIYQGGNMSNGGGIFLLVCICVMIVISGGQTLSYSAKVRQIKEKRK